MEVDSKRRAPARKPVPRAPQKAKRQLTHDAAIGMVHQILLGIEEHIENASVANDGEPFAERVLTYAQEWALTRVYDKLDLDAYCDKTTVAALEPLNDLQAMLKAAGQLTESAECRDRMNIAFEMVDRAYELLDQDEGFWPAEPQLSDARKSEVEKNFMAGKALCAALAHFMGSKADRRERNHALCAAYRDDDVYVPQENAALLLVQQLVAYPEWAEGFAAALTDFFQECVPDSDAVEWADSAAKLTFAACRELHLPHNPDAAYSAPSLAEQLQSVYLGVLLPEAMAAAAKNVNSGAQPPAPEQDAITADMLLNTQLVNLLEQIATLANATDDFLRHIPVSGDPNLAEAKAYYLRGQVERMGWMADLGFEQATGGHQVRGNSEDWLLPHGCRTSTKEGRAA